MNDRSLKSSRKGEKCMSNMLLINKSGKTMPVYSTDGGNTVIGHIYDREAYVYDSDAGGDGVFNGIQNLKIPLQSFRRCMHYLLLKLEIKTLGCLC